MLFRSLARKSSSTVGIVACGVQGRSNLEGLSCVFKIKKVKAYDIYPEIAEHYAGEMEKALQLDIEPVREVSTAVKNMDIVACWPTMSSGTCARLWHRFVLDQDRNRRDPVAPAKPSVSVKRKKAARVTDEGLAVQSFDTLLKILGTRCRNLCKVKAASSGSSFFQLTEPTPLQSRALQLLDL